MKAFIRGIGNISPQATFDNAVFLDEIRQFDTSRLQALEPDYKKYIQPNQLRRMSRLLKMGVTAAGICLQDAKTDKPDAIITGTGLGMMEETEKFLNGILDNGEKLLNPTAFIQSTHNTVGASIAVMLGCNNYNLTYVHGPLSFENALLDSLMWLAEKPSDKVLIGGIEEITNSHFIITDSMGFWKKGGQSNLELFETPGPGTIAGEGAAFFLLSDEAHPDNYACIQGLSTNFNPGFKPHAASFIADFLAQHKLDKNDIDLVLTGMNGDQENDAHYDAVLAYFGRDAAMARYKHLCGEHYLASSFALWLAASIIKKQNIPDVILMNTTSTKKNIRNILLYNHYQNLHHSLILVSSC
jgi:3-oxoacyl-(acyl-carrier-protein) synthase